MDKISRETVPEMQISVNKVFYIYEIRGNNQQIQNYIYIAFVQFIYGTGQKKTTKNHLLSVFNS